MAEPAVVALSGLPAPSNFDVIGDLATLSQSKVRCIGEFGLFWSDSGITNHTQKRALLLHIGGYGIREILNTYPEATRGTDDEYDKTVIKLSSVCEVISQKRKTCRKQGRTLYH